MRGSMKWLLLSLCPFLLPGAEARFFLPFDGTPDVAGPKGEKYSPAMIFGRNTYVDGVSGKALLVRRHAYDQVTAVNLNKLPEMEWREGTVSFFFRPEWNGSDPGTRWLFHATKNNKLRIYFIKNKPDGLELSVCTDGFQRQILVKNPLKAGKWVHLAFSWSIPEGKSAVYLDGKPLGRKSDEKWKNSNLRIPCSPSVWLGKSTSDRFKAEVGEGAYDNLRIYDRFLEENEILTEALGGRAVKMKNLPTTHCLQKNGALNFRFRYTADRIVSPQVLLVLKSGKSDLALSTMGASGKLALNGGGKVLESPYVFDLKRPLKLSFEPAGKQKMLVLFDDAAQGFLEVPNGWDSLKEVCAIEGISLLPPEIPAEETLSLKKKSSGNLEKKLWDLSDAQNVVHGSVRKGISLNGIWRIFGNKAYSYAPEKETIQRYSRVPGSFRSVYFQHYCEKKGKLEKLDGKPYQTTAGWYQRTFQVPKEWKGKRIFLNFENLHADYGRVYLNGKLIDSFRQDFKYFSAVPNARRIDVTDQLEDENVLSVFLDRFVVVFWKDVPHREDHHTIAIDNVWLECAPSRVSLKSAISFPSFRKKNVEMRTTILNPAGERGTAKVDFLYGRAGGDRKFSKNFRLTGEKEQRIVFTESWKNPVLWNYETPNLYTLSVRLSVNGSAADALPDCDFGFREAWVVNGEFRFNGLKTRYRMATYPLLEQQRMYLANPRAMAQFVAQIRKMNYDTVRFNPNVIISHYGELYFQDYLREAGRQGLYNLFPMPSYEGEAVGPYKKEVERFLEHYGRFPSIIMWYTDFNTCSYSENQDPYYLNNTEFVPKTAAAANRKLAKVADDMMRSLDPSRECFQHAGGNSGKIFGSMNYQSFGTPLQEQEDWPKIWSAKHTQPLMVVESGFPYPFQYLYFDGPKGHYLCAEHAARYFGDSVYRQEKIPAQMGIWRMFSPYAPRPFNYFLLSGEMYRRVVRAWRAYDVSAVGDFTTLQEAFRGWGSGLQYSMFWGVDDNVKSAGVRPDREHFTYQVLDYLNPEKFGEVIRKEFEPLRVFLAGPVEDFTNKDHAFFSNEKFEKSIVVINDRTTVQNLRFRWRFMVGDEQFDRGELSVKAEPGALLKLPLHLTAPEVAVRSEGKIHLHVFRNGEGYDTDSFDVQIFPKRGKPDFRYVPPAGLYDPAGKTEGLLKAAGFPYRKISTPEEAKKCRLIIIGQNALGEHVPAFLKELELSGEFRLGRKILIFEQKQCNLGNLIFESPSCRDAFIRRPESPYLRGLKDVDLKNLRGASDTVPAKIVSKNPSPHYPRSKWKIGNSGMVAGNVIRKPSYGNFRTIVDCGFNLMFAALMELKQQHGHVLFCQLDVTSRYGKDPAVTLLVDNILTEMATPFLPVNPQKVIYLGDRENEKILQKMGLVYEKKGGWTPGELAGYEVVILGRDGIQPSARENFRKEFAQKEKNRTILCLPGAPLDLLPVPLKKRRKPVFRVEIPKDDPMFSGVTEADLYFRTPKEMEVLETPDWSVRTNPAVIVRHDFQKGGAIVVLNLSPEMFDDTFWNKEKVSRVWSTIFSNMNLSLGRDLKLFTGRRMRHNTITPLLGKIPLEKGQLGLDPKNSGKVSCSNDFRPIRLGEAWEKQGITQNNPYHVYPKETPLKMRKMYDGYAWIRIPVTIPESWKEYIVRLYGGPIDDADWTSFNGVRIGETTFEKCSDPYARKRSYPIPSRLIRYGKENTLLIRVYDRWGAGGVVGPLQVVAEDSGSADAWSPYIDGLDFYDVDAFHNW